MHARTATSELTGTKGTGRKLPSLVDGTGRTWVLSFCCVKNKSQVALTVLIKILPRNKTVEFSNLYCWIHSDKSLWMVTSSFIMSQFSRTLWLWWPQDEWLYMNLLLGEKHQKSSSCSNCSRTSCPLVGNSSMTSNKCCTIWHFHDKLSLAKQPATSLTHQSVLWLDVHANHAIIFHYIMKYIQEEDEKTKQNKKTLILGVWRIFRRKTKKILCRNVIRKHWNASLNFNTWP